MITVVSVTGVNKDAHQEAIDRTRCATPYPTKPLLLYIEGMDYFEYNRFILQDLWKYIITPHALIVQADGYAFNPEKLTEEWLDFDYTGAPWPDMIVGNGGFSLRSKRFLEASRHIDYQGGNEDDLVCRRPLPGMKYCPPHLAQRFSHELVGDLDDSFGFHGRYPYHSHLVLG
jgi:hypothetical protein